jgi:hypothetical protein
MEPDALLRQATGAVYLDDKRAGTGWLLDNAGHVVTAGHIVINANLKIELDSGDGLGRITADKVYAKFDLSVGIDVAVLKLKEFPTGRQPLPIRHHEFPSGTFRLYGFGKSLLHRSSGTGEFAGSYEPGNNAGSSVFKRQLLRIVL